MATATPHPLIRLVRRLGGARPGPDLPDADLLVRFTAHGDADAFAALVRRHGPLVLGVCRRVLGDWHAAEDCFQEVFALLVRKGGSLRAPEGVGPWLFGVAHRTARAARARAGRRAACERKAATAPAVEQPDDLLWRDLRPVLDDAVARLPAKHRVPFVLHYLQGVSVEGVADRLGWPRGTVATRLARARAQLRKGLARRGVTLSGAALAAGLSAAAVSGAVSPRFLSRSVQAAVLAGQKRFTEGAAGAAAFGKGGLNPMLTMKGKRLAAVLLVVALAAGGARLLAPGARADSQEKVVPADRPGPAPAAPAAPAAARAEKTSVVEKQFRQYQVEVTLARPDAGGRDLGPHGKAVVLGEPRLLTVEGQVATYQSGGQVPVPGDEPGHVAFLEVGLAVRVKVKRLGDGRLRVDTALERSRVEDSGKKNWRRQRSLVEATERVQLGEAVKLVEKDNAGRALHWALVRVVSEESIQSRTETHTAEAGADSKAARGQGNPAYVIEPPDVLQLDSAEGLLPTPVRGPHLVRPDGTVGLGTYGSAAVAGLTVERARAEIARAIQARLGPGGKSLEELIKGLSVDVLASNSRVYYVLTDLAGKGQHVYRFPATGKETVLDAVAQVEGLPPEASRCRLWVERANGKAGGRQEVLRVDWEGIASRGEFRTNYRLRSGDRLYVKGVGK
jgi:RNA polymerase sigma factor (sigma-70 family)